MHRARDCQYLARLRLGLVHCEHFGSRCNGPDLSSSDANASPQIPCEVEQLFNWGIRMRLDDKRTPRGQRAVEAARRRPKPRDEVGATNSAIYSSKIIKAGALLADTKTLLAHWNSAVPVQVNLDRLRRENVFGKASRSRVEDILTIFRQRFLSEESVTKALARSETSPCCHP
jgi:Putative inner membrane protein (DUF1819)